MITAEEKLLRAFVKLASRKKEYPVKQEEPVCPRCKTAIDITDPSVRVDFHDVEAGGRLFVVAEPTCPNCFTRVKPRAFVNN